MPDTTTEHGPMIAALDAELSKLNAEPCRWPDDLCLEPHKGEGPAWQDMKPERMCNGCRAYWHLSIAIHELRRLDHLAR